MSVLTAGEGRPTIVAVPNSNRGEHIKQNAEAISRRDTLSEFQFPESTESGRFVKASSDG
jgi:hypothetical protein